MIRRWLPVLCVAGLLVGGCADDQVDEPIGASLDTVAPGELTACVSETPRLVESTDDGFAGHDVEVLEHVADELGLPLSLVEVPFDELLSGVALNGLRCDLGAAGVAEDPALDAVVRTSVPYRVVDRLVLTREDTDVVVDDPATFAGHVGVEDGGLAADAVDALEAAEIVRYPSGGDLRRGFATGEVDAVLVSPTEVASVRDEVGAVAVDARVPTDAQTVLLYPQGADPALIAAVDEVLLAFVGSTLQAELEVRWLTG